MTASFLVPEQTIEQDGTGEPVPVEGGATIELTLGITEVLEQQSLDVMVHGSTDGAEWSKKPLAAFPQKFYRGTQSILLPLAEHAGVTQIRAQWKVNRWGRGSEKPTFRFYLFAKDAAQ